jgi:hypothetical protein
MGEGDRLRLPVYPRVEARGNAVIIIEEDGEERLWDFEDDESVAIAVAEEIQLGLRAIHCVRTSLLISLREIVDFLRESGVPSEHLGNILYEGYQSIQKLLIELDRRVPGDISMSA